MLLQRFLRDAVLRPIRTASPLFVGPSRRAVLLFAQSARDFHHGALSSALDLIDYPFEYRVAFAPCVDPLVVPLENGLPVLDVQVAGCIQSPLEARVGDRSPCSSTKASWPTIPGTQALSFGRFSRRPCPDRLAYRPCLESVLGASGWA